MSESSSEHPADQIQRLQDRLRVLSDVTHGFAEATTDYQRLLDTVARSLTEVVKDCCVVLLLSDDGACMLPVSIYADEPAALQQVRNMFAAGPLKLHEQPALQRLLQTGEALLVPHLDHSLPRDDTTQEQVQAQVALGVHSYLVVALRFDGRSIGALALGRYRPDSPPFGEHDRNLAQNLADHASLAIANARLYSAEKQARRAAELAEESVRKSEEAHRLFFEWCVARRSAGSAPIAAISSRSS